MWVSGGRTGRRLRSEGSTTSDGVLPARCDDWLSLLSGSARPVRDAGGGTW